jgi:hypothetical protein
MKKWIMSIILLFSFNTLKPKSVEVLIVPQPANPIVKKTAKPVKLKERINKKLESFFTRQKTKTGCFRTCKAIIENYGKANNLKLKVKNSKFRDQIAIEENGKLVNLKSPLSKIDSLLKLGLPVLIGVHHTFNYGYNEGTTDHFIIITKKDDSGYYYFDPGRKDNINKLMVMDNTLKNNRYEITQIRDIADAKSHPITGSR